MDYQNPHQGLTSAQKTGFVLLLVFGVLAVGMGILQMRNNIFGPFALRIDKTQLEEANLFMDEDARLQSIDTDHDGLNDYEEMNFYETSAYLPDTDSDGLDDKTEIEKGKNPLCAEGEACGAAEAVPVKATSTIDIGPAEIKGGIQPADFLSNLVPTQGQVDIGSELKKWMANPAELREMLLATGNISKEDLEKIDDATLVKLLQASVEEQGGGSLLYGTQATASSTTNTTTL